MILDTLSFQSTIIDTIDFAREDQVNSGLVSTGVTPIAVGSVETFKLQAYNNGLPVDLTGGTVSLKLRDPLGNVTTVSATISGGIATATWTVTAVAGQDGIANWTRCWVVSGGGITQTSRPIGFATTTSP